MISATEKSACFITGVMMNYFHICHTELWLFAYDIQMEQESDVVALGKLTHEIVAQPRPPKPEKIPFCRRCSYRELCWC